MDDVNYGLTLRPEWAFAVAHLGKDIENRTKVARRLIGKRIAIHAGLSWGGKRTRSPWDRMLALQGPCRRATDAGHPARIESHPQTVVVRIDGDPRAWHSGDLTPPAHTPHATPIPTAAIVATAVVSSIGMDQDSLRSPWAVAEHWHWRLTDVAVLETPIPCTGHIALGWTLPAAVRQQLATAQTAPAWRTAA